MYIPHFCLQFLFTSPHLLVIYATNSNFFAEERAGLNESICLTKNSSPVTGKLFESTITSSLPFFIVKFIIVWAESRVEILAETFLR